MLSALESELVDLHFGEAQIVRAAKLDSHILPLRAAYRNSGGRTGHSRLMAAPRSSSVL